VCLLLLCAAWGCGGSAGTIAGKVSYRGKVLAGGTVTLFNADGVKIRSVPIRPDGSYRASGLPVGLTKIAVESKAPSGLPPVLVPRPPEKYDLADGATPAVPIPPHYKDAGKSGLTVEVTAGDQKHDIDLP
jgi:hypothetical protein